MSKPVDEQPEYACTVEGLFPIVGRPTSECSDCAEHCRTLVLAARRYPNGASATWLQCRACKRGVRAVGRADVAAALAAGCTIRVWDDAHERALDARVRSAQEEYALRRDATVAERRAFYETYIRSEKWASIRRRVLARDGNVCQGCLNAFASQVHHKTYDHLGDELLFELVSLCVDCHEKIHPHMRETG